jgi:hypothetical protein
MGGVLEIAVEGDWEEMARKELEFIKKTSCVLLCGNPLPGYD